LGQGIQPPNCAYRLDRAIQTDPLLTPPGCNGSWTFRHRASQGPSACPTHVSTNPCALESGSSPSSASIRTLPPSSFVLQVPHCPCRQDEGYGDSMLLGRFQYGLAATNCVCLARSSELDHHVRLGCRRNRLSALRSGDAETLLHNAFGLHSQTGKDGAAGVHERRRAAEKEVP